MTLLLVQFKTIELSEIEFDCFTQSEILHGYLTDQVFC